MSQNPRRGGPDYAAPPYTLASGTVDPGLSAEFVALGLSRIDSLGRPYLFLNYQNAPPFVKSLAGAGAGITCNINNAYVGAAALKIDPGTSGAGIARSRTQLTFLPSNRLGLEAIVNPFGLAVTFGIQMNTLLPAYLARLYADRAANEWRIKTPAASIGLGIPLATVWTVVKIVADFSTGKYIRAVVGSPSAVPTRLDLSAYSMETTASVAAFEIENFSNGSGANQYHHVGYTLLTVDEP